MNPKPKTESSPVSALLKRSSKVLLRVVSVLATLVFLAGIWLVLIVAEPQHDTGVTPPVTTALVNPSPEVNIRAESDLYKLLLTFPAPVMSFLSGSGMTFVSGSSMDVAVEGGYGRVVTLNWMTPEEKSIVLTSVYPAGAISLLGKGDYSFGDKLGPDLCGKPSVRMENKKTIRLHIQTDQGLYYLTIPADSASLLNTWTRSVQLFSISP